MNLAHHLPIYREKLVIFMERLWNIVMDGLSKERFHTVLLLSAVVWLAYRDIRREMVVDAMYDGYVKHLMDDSREMQRTMQEVRDAVRGFSYQAQIQEIKNR
jgi:hypothetical protein